MQRSVALGALLLWARASMASGGWDDAAALSERWRARLLEGAALAAEAGRIPWPLLPGDVEGAVAEEAASGTVDVEWAADRLLPVLAGELPASGALVDAMLSAVGRSPATTLEERAAARRAYAEGRTAEASGRYRRLEGSSEVWREAAWVHYVAGDAPRALGEGVTLASPWLPGEDHAEGRLSTAMVMRDQCRFEEARRLVAPLVSAPEAGPPEDLAARVLSASEGSEDPLLREVRASPVVRRLREVLQGVAPPETPAGEALRHASEGGVAVMIRRVWDAASESRRGVAERALALRYDALRAERSLRANGWAPESAKAPALPAVADDELVWAFDGVWWRDELGHYRTLAASRCPREGR